MKRGLSLLLVLLTFSLVFVMAQDGDLGEGGVDEEEEEVIDLEELENEFDEEELELPGAGLTPDSFFYFLDGLVDSREEKFAEIQEMIRQGKIEEARQALGKYKDYISELEQDPDPNKREEARRAAARIHKALQDLEKDLDEDLREEFYDEILDDEKGVVTAVEISNKIKELCVQLAELDPLQFDRVCKTEEDSADWRKDLFEDLTDEQKKEAEEFGEIMGDCFRTSGKECRCEDISFVAMSEMCLAARPLAVACDIDNDETACEKLDSLEFPEMPRYLEEVLERVEQRYAEDNFDHHIPGPCKEAGITGSERGDRERCFEIMIEIETPEECRDAIKEAGVRNEREARKICEEIMFELDAPEECLEAGIRDGEECGQFIFKLEAPEECLEAGFDGSRRSDYRECDKLMENLYEIEEDGRRHFGVDCLRIPDEGDRLRCFENAASGNFREEFENREREDYRRDFEEQFRDIREKERECAQKCSDENSAWDFSGGDCRCFDPYEEFEDNFEKDLEEFEEFAEEFEEEFKELEEELEEEFDEEDDFDEEKEEEIEEELEEEIVEDNSGGEENGGGEEESSETTSGITGQVVISDKGNGFLDYFFR